MERRKKPVDVDAVKFDSRDKVSNKDLTIVHVDAEVPDNFQHTLGSILEKVNKANPAETSGIIRDIENLRSRASAEGFDAYKNSGMSGAEMFGADVSTWTQNDFKELLGVLDSHTLVKQAFEAQKLYENNDDVVGEWKRDNSASREGVPQEIVEKLADNLVTYIDHSFVNNKNYPPREGTDMSGLDNFKSKEKLDRCLDGSGSPYDLGVSRQVSVMFGDDVAAAVSRHLRGESFGSSRSDSRIKEEHFQWALDFSQKFSEALAGDPRIIALRKEVAEREKVAEKLDAAKGEVHDRAQDAFREAGLDSTSVESKIRELLIANGLDKNSIARRQREITARVTGDVEKEIGTALRDLME